MSVVARRIKSIPARSASDTWLVIVDLLAADATDARDELLRVDGIASCLISSEAIKDTPIVVRGKGPCIRVYGLYGEDAIVGDNANEAQLATCPTDGDWSMSLPAPTEDLEWVQQALAKRSARVTARDMKEAFTVSDEPVEKQAQPIPTINPEAFFRS